MLMIVSRAKLFSRIVEAGGLFLGGFPGSTPWLTHQTGLNWSKHWHFYQVSGCFTPVCPLQEAHRLYNNHIYLPLSVIIMIVTCMHKHAFYSHNDHVHLYYYGHKHSHNKLCLLLCTWLKHRNSITSGCDRHTSETRLAQYIVPIAVMITDSWLGIVMDLVLGSYLVLPPSGQTDPPPQRLV